MSALTVLLCVAAGAAISGVVFYLVFFSARKNEEAERIRSKEELRSLLELAEQKFATERVRQSAELDEKRKAVETAVTRLSDQLKDYEGLMKTFEAERREKYGSLERGLKDASETTQKLASTTEGLRSLLENSRARGQWGERMAEDILRASGLQENVQYLKNRSQETVASRPDFTFLLPDDHRLNMDVKFPLDNYLRMVNAQAEEERERAKDQFLRDVKNRIKEIQKREYINPAEKTLDYVLLFIPNEQVYGFIHEALPGLVDDALVQKVVLCSPFTLYAVLSIVRQSFDNFYFARATQEVLALISNFAAVYEKFRERFAKLGDELDKTRAAYDEISQTSFKRLDQAVAKIDRVRKGESETEPNPESKTRALPILPGKPRD
ncbi:MAG: DNA recombination protein RmuC [Elusimicrobia bacterium]|nr:DNA recombination protein RmuC [Elusimicrobiota bacterium]